MSNEALIDCIGKFVGNSNFKLLNGGKLFSSLKLLLSNALCGGGDELFCLGIKPPSVIALFEDGAIIKAAKLVELLLADIIGVVVDDKPNTGELGKVKFFPLTGELGLDFFNLCFT